MVSRTYNLLNFFMFKRQPGLIANADRKGLPLRSLKHQKFFKTSISIAIGNRLASQRKAKCFKGSVRIFGKHIIHLAVKMIRKINCSST